MCLYIFDTLKKKVFWGALQGCQVQNVAQQPEASLKTLSASHNAHDSTIEDTTFAVHQFSLMLFLGDKSHARLANCVSQKFLIPIQKSAHILIPVCLQVQTEGRLFVPAN